eukprot:g17310.t1
MGRPVWILKNFKRHVIFSSAPLLQELDVNMSSKSIHLAVRHQDRHDNFSVLHSKKVHFILETLEILLV